MSLYLSPGLPLVAAWLAFFEPSLFLRLAAAILLHESAHLLLIALYHRTIRQIGLTLSGVRIRLEPGRGDAAIAVAGGMANLLCAFCLLQSRPAAASVQLAAGLFPLLPLPGSDGEDWLRAMILHPLSPERAEGVLRFVMRITAVVLFAVVTLLYAVGRCHWLLPVLAAGKILAVWKQTNL